MDRKRLAELMQHLDYDPAPLEAGEAFSWLEEHDGRFGHFIGGRWSAPGGKLLPVIDPSSGTAIARVTMGNAKDAGRAAGRAADALRSWSRTAGVERAGYLRAIARAVARHASLFALVESLETGDPVGKSRGIDIPLAIRHLEKYAVRGAMEAGGDPGGFAQGVTAAILPRHSPLPTLASRIAPAIAAGNTVVIKPSESTPLTALLFAEILREEVRLPPGVVNVITGGVPAGEALVRHPRVRSISYAGSAEGGRRILGLAAGSGKHVALELDGNTIFLIFGSADIDSAVEGTVEAAFVNRGWIYSGGSLLLVEESVYHPVIERITRRMERLRAGSALDATTDVGPIRSEERLEDIARLCRREQEGGAEIRQPASWRRPEQGFHYPPTLIANVREVDAFAAAHPYGPVLACMSFRTPAEAMQSANMRRGIHAASIWTQDISLALDCAYGVRAEKVWINVSRAFDESSGIGAMENGCEVLREMFPWKGSRAKSWSGKALSKREREKILDGRATGRRTGHAGETSSVEIRAAVAAARETYPLWSGRSSTQRARSLHSLWEHVQMQRERLAGAISLDTNLPLESSRKELEATLLFLFTTAAYIDKHEGTAEHVSGKNLVINLREPIGVVGIVAGDEFPLLGVAAPAVAALAAGNGVVLANGRHPLAGLDLSEILRDAGLPPGCVKILPAGDPDQAGILLAEQEEVDAVWHFGSAAGGAAVENITAGNLKRSFVAGGNVPAWGDPILFAELIDAATKVKQIRIPYGV